MLGARRRVIGLAVVAAATCCALTAGSAGAETITYGATGAAAWNPSADIESAAVEVSGAAGGSGLAGSGGLGGSAAATIDIDASFYGVNIGSRGRPGTTPFVSGGAGGVLGGGNGSCCAPGPTGGGGGGGATFFAAGDATVPANWLLIAGGGGGSGTTSVGGAGGGLTGAPGAAGTRCVIATGGDQTGSTGSGQQINGGDGVASTPAGGGGGGYYGGAGGGPDTQSNACGGGGGSGYIDPTVRNGSFPSPTATNNGSITITYFTLTVNVNGPGTVVGPGIECGSSGDDCTLSLAPGDPWILGVVPNTTGQFDSWSGACSGTGDCQGTMSADITVNATFSEQAKPPTPPDETAPDTRIRWSPKARTYKPRKLIRFGSPVKEATFECSLNGAEFSSCSSPAKVRSKPGRNVFRVRAVSSGLTDATPAKAKWSLKRR